MKKLAIAVLSLLLSAASAMSAVTIVDPTLADCTTTAKYIHHDQMVASVASKFHGAKILLNSAAFDTTGRKVEVYWDQTDDVLILTLVTRSLNSTQTAWQVLASSPTCMPDPTQAVPFPPPVAP